MLRGHSRSSDGDSYCNMATGHGIGSNARR